ncbi:Alpha/Beta hydrolase protein [Phyllosticta citrichinensis]|uniref:Carboxylic ester hydrolase n=1 Tax=Phyllosticta citrichinensis TaxID=1130410 RepID=A0ABR1XS72_9PEZI
MSAPSISHPALGEVRGKARDDTGVVQFLGIKYATLRDRFAPAELIEEAHGVDATKYGLPVISPQDSCDSEQTYIQQPLPKPADAPKVQSDIDGLNLNVTVPTLEEKNLPVLVFIHGGGFRQGANWFPQYDFAQLVKFGVEKEMPFIGININYRLGLPGFLTSSEFKEHGYQPNNGIRDQTVALRWIKKHIAGFGGDPDNVTLMGQSAGAISTVYQLNSSEPLFKRAIPLGGSPLLLKPLSPEIAEANYRAVISAFGLADLPPAERLDRLRTLPPVELLTKVPPSVFLGPVVDGETVREAHDFDQLKEQVERMPGAQWCRELLLGCCSLDVSIFAYTHPRMAQSALATAFITSLTNSLSKYPTLAKRLLDTYGITPATPDPAALSAITELGSDISARAPARAYAAAWTTEHDPSPLGFQDEPPTPTPRRHAHVLIFATPNPWPGKWHRRATHILDVAYLFLNYAAAGRLPTHSLPAAHALAADVLGYVRGRGLRWRPYFFEQPPRGADEAPLLSGTRAVSGGGGGGGGGGGKGGGKGARGASREWQQVRPAQAAQVAVYGETVGNVWEGVQEVAEDRLVRCVREEGVGVGVVARAWERWFMGM